MSEHVPCAECGSQPNVWVEFGWENYACPVCGYGFADGPWHCAAEAWAEEQER